MKLGKWKRFRSSRENAPTEFNFRVRRVVDNSNEVAVIVNRFYNDSDFGFDCGWTYSIMSNIPRKITQSYEQFNNRELAMFTADLHLIELGFEIEDPFKLDISFNK